MVILAQKADARLHHLSNKIFDSSIPGHFIIKGMFLPFLLMKGKVVAAMHMCSSLLKYSDRGL